MLGWGGRWDFEPTTALARSGYKSARAARRLCRSELPRGGNDCALRPPRSDLPDLERAAVAPRTSRLSACGPAAQRSSAAFLCEQLHIRLRAVGPRLASDYPPAAWTCVHVGTTPPIALCVSETTVSRSLQPGRRTNTRCRVRYRCISVLLGLPRACAAAA